MDQGLLRRLTTAGSALTRAACAIVCTASATAAPVPGGAAVAPAQSAQADLPRAASAPAGLRGADDRALQPGGWFREAARSAGVDFTQSTGHRPGRFLFPEIMTGGVGLFDYDNDGALDLLLIQGGSLDASAAESAGDRLYRNRGDGTFVDVTTRSGIRRAGYGMGCACADYDGDGDVDVYVTCVGPNVLFRNNGDGTFSDVTATAGVGHPGWGTSATFLDYDRDGDADLCVVNYVNWSMATEIECFSLAGEADYCGPNNYKAPARDVLYRNNGDGTFSDVSDAAGLDQAFGNGLGVVAADFNGDDLVDIYASNDQMPNQLWINRGDGRFADEALIRGCAVDQSGMAQASMGTQAFDVEDDGDLDVFITNLRGEANILYLNDGTGHFEAATAAAGLAAPSVPYTGFGTGFADFDQDGLPDVFVVNGRVKLADPVYDPTHRYSEPSLLFRCVSSMKYEPVPICPAGHAAICGTSRGAAFGDLDGDGDVDVVVNNLDARPFVLRNEASPHGQWIMFRVLDRRGMDALGAVVTVESGGRTQRRLVQPGYSYCSSNDPRLHFGLGTARRADAVAVRWPDGAAERFGPRPAGLVHVLQRGAGGLAPPASSPSDPPGVR